MQFNNKQFGSAAKPFKESPFTQSYEFPGNNFPPGECLLGIAATSGVLALQVGGFLSVHCPTEIFNLVDYLGNTYSDYQNNNYIEIQTG